MTRLIIGAIVLALAAAGCSGTGTQGSPEKLANVQQAINLQSPCRSFDAYTAGLAEATIDCLGAIGPSDYAVDATGLLVPTFDRCPAEPTPPPRQVGGTAKRPQVPALLRIKAILSVQQRPSAILADGSPLALRCIRDA